MQWEYRVTTFKFDNDDELSSALNAQGVDGWELVAVEVTEVTADSDEYRCIFKRFGKSQYRG